MPPSRDEVFAKVRDVLTDALGIDAEDVTPQARLQKDLGAESIDMLDIVFRLEKTFEIKIPKGELFPEDLQSNADNVVNNKVTPAGLVKLKAAMPHADFADFERDPDVSRIWDLFTVQTIVNYVDAKLRNSVSIGAS